MEFDTEKIVLNGQIDHEDGQKESNIWDHIKNFKLTIFILT